MLDHSVGLFFVCVSLILSAGSTMESESIEEWIYFKQVQRLFGHVGTWECITPVTHGISMWVAAANQQMHFCYDFAWLRASCTHVQYRHCLLSSVTYIEEMARSVDSATQGYIFHGWSMYCA